MTDNQSFFDQFFHYASRAIIIIPVITVIIALLFKFSNQDIKKQAAVEKVLPSVEPTVKADSSVQINLDGPFVCLFETKEATISAYIKDKKIFSQVVDKNGTKNFLLNGDCLYIWTANVFSGEKKCGLSQYINTFEMLSSIGITNMNSLAGSLKSIGGLSTEASQEAAIKNLISSCKKEEIKNEDIFKLPRYVLFN